MEDPDSAAHNPPGMHVKLDSRVERLRRKTAHRLVFLGPLSSRAAVTRGSRTR